MLFQNDKLFILGSNCPIKAAVCATSARMKANSQSHPSRRTVSDFGIHLQPSKPVIHAAAIDIGPILSYIVNEGRPIWSYLFEQLEWIRGTRVSRRFVSWRNPRRPQGPFRRIEEDHEGKSSQEESWTEDAIAVTPPHLDCDGNLGHVRRIRSWKIRDRR